MDSISEDLAILEKELESLYVPSSNAVGRKATQSESPSSYFLAKSFVPGSTSMLYNDKDEEVRDDRGINKICHSFYSKLYSRKLTPSDSDREHIYSFLPPEDYSRKLKEDEFEVLQAEISKSELFDALQKMKSGSAPGLDGLTVEFYTTFWEVVGDFVFDSLLAAHEAGSFSITQKRGVIKLIPKKGKNPHFVRNLRPITLLNVDFKILTKLLAL